MSVSASASIEPEVAINGAVNGSNGVKPEEENIASVDLEKARSSFQDKAQSYLADQGRPVVIPSFGKWFDMNVIHELEKQSFPDFFPTDDSKKSIYRTGDSYKYIRDFLVNCYRLNPLEYLSVTAARRSLAGDVTTIIRVHQFLEKWGLINYQIDPRTKSTLVGPQYTGHFQVTLDTPRGLVPFIPETFNVTNVQATTEPSAITDEAEVKAEDLKEIPMNLEVRRNVYNETNEGKENSSQYICSTTGKSITDVKYYNLKSKGLANIPGATANNATYISEECYDQGLFPSNFTSSNFVKIAQQQEQEEWSQQEILLLLEGIEIYGSYDLVNSSTQSNSNTNGQWVKISEHVGTKSKEQCIVKFVQLPIEDRYLTKLVDKKQDKPFDKESLIQEITIKLINENDGNKILQKNATSNIEDINKDEANLLQQISELTLQKISVKLERLKTLEDDLLEIEKKLTLERKQVAVERWTQYEKVLNFKQTNANPELNQILDDLLQPVSLQEIDSIQKKADDEKVNDKANSKSDIDNLPVSVTKPQTYKFWSG